ncbi:MAG: HD domain-containing protein [Dehalococcoidia bacterium]
MADPLSTARYRVGQVLRGLRTTIEAADATAVRSLLTPAELQLFLRMHPRDRKHSICVMRRLEAAAGSQALLVAALLHDVAKGRPRVWERALFTVLEAVSPRLVERLATQRGMRWRRALQAMRHHAQAGAELLRESSSTEAVIELVRRHSGRDRPHQPDGELARLIAADGAC